MNAVLRIIDANLNRAREAMRVMEEYARFVLDDRLLAAACKDARHELADCVRGFEGRLQGIVGLAGTARPTRADAEAERRAPNQPDATGAPNQPDGEAAALLPGQRDIVGDVGQAVKTAAEMERTHPDEVATAAGKRLSEALRTIEEYGKVLDRGLAEGIEKLRYRGYELERRLALTVRGRERWRDVRLYVILTEALCKGDWFDTAQAALDGGADCLQLREKTLPDRELLDRARRLADLCREHGKMLIVNDRPDVAAAAKASGVHVGQDDLPLAAVRRVLQPGGIVGLSTHTPEQVERAAAEAPDYIAVGPMFPTETKPQPLIATPELLKTARRLTSIPLVAIGGVTVENAESVVAAGADCLCVCTAVIGADAPSAAARKLRAVFSS